MIGPATYHRRHLELKTPRAPGNSAEHASPGGGGAGVVTHHLPPAIGCGCSWGACSWGRGFPALPACPAHAGRAGSVAPGKPRGESRRGWWWEARLQCCANSQHQWCGVVLLRCVSRFCTLSLILLFSLTVEPTGSKPIRRVFI